MNLLTDDLPRSVEIDGKDYPIVTDFRNWIRFFELIEDEKLSDSQRLRIAMLWFTEETPEATEEAWEALLSFALCKDIPKSGKKSSDNAGKDAAAPCFSWSYDAPFILGAFWQTYGIDLLSCNIHWYEFFALFQALPDDVPLKQRIALRQMKTADIKDRERRKQIRAAQKSIAIPRPALTAEQIGEAFM